MSRKTVELRRKVDQATGSDYNRKIRLAAATGGRASGVQRLSGAHIPGLRAQLVRGQGKGVNATARALGLN